MITVTATRQLDSGAHAIASVSAGQYGAFESVTLQRGDLAEQVYYWEGDSAPFGHACHDSAALATYAAAMLGTILRQRKCDGHSD